MPFFGLRDLRYPAAGVVPDAPGDILNLVQDVDAAFGTGAIQDFRWANQGVREAETRMRNGDRGLQVDDQSTWLRDAGEWVETTLSMRHFQGAQATTNNSSVDLTSNSSGGFGSTIASGTNLITVVRAGWYRITATANWASSSTGMRLLEITLNGSAPSPRIGSRVVAEGAPAQTATGLRFLSAGTVIRAQVLQTSGGALAVVGSLSVEFIRGGSGVS